MPLPQTSSRPYSSARRSRAPPSPDQMHADFLGKYPDMFAGLKDAIKDMFPTILHPRRTRVSVIIRGMQTYPPQWPVATAMLHELFPVLAGARAVDDPVMQAASARSSMDSMAAYFQCFQTAQHGRVAVMIVTANRNNVTDMTFEVFEETSDGGYRMELDSGVPLDRRVKPGEEYKSLALVCMIPLRSECAGCGTEQDERRFSRCARCWERLRFPVWYCCRGCQVAHYPQHRRLCGKAG